MNVVVFLLRLNSQRGYSLKLNWRFTCEKTLITFAKPPQNPLILPAKAKTQNKGKKTKKDTKK
ncbi:hypothetical protein BKI52_31450 [marine bacterium AO1-C]|nr:hypothetical protein BKI52_31450 [marine bacterium AO1-C]